MTQSLSPTYSYSAKELSILQKGATVQIFGSNPNQPNSIHEENYTQTEATEYLLSFGADTFGFQFAIQKYKD